MFLEPVPQNLWAFWKTSNLGTSLLPAQATQARRGMVEAGGVGVVEVSKWRNTTFTPII